MIKKLILPFILLFATCSFAMTKANIQIEMTNKIDKVLIVIKDSSLSKNEKANEIISLMNSAFDYTLMSRLSLGKAWKKISKEERVDFIKLFTQMLKDSYVDKLDLYTDELVKVIGTSEPKRNRLILKTQLIGKDAKHDINYKFYKVKNAVDTWLIYDIDLIGVSIIKTYQSQFKGFLKDKTFQELLVHLKTKNKDS